MPEANRQTSTKTLNGQSTSKRFTIDPASNKLNGFTQQQGATTTNVAYQYNPNGDLTSDGLKRFSYNAEGRMSDVTTGATDTSPTTRYAYNALGQRVFKTEPIYPPAAGDESDPGFFQSLLNFFSKAWAPAVSDAEKLGTAYFYDENGSVITETGTGGPNSTGTTNYVYLQTASGPMPIVAFINGVPYAVHSDQLNTPRRMTNANAQVVWQWQYSAFGEEKPTTANNRFADPAVNPNPGSTGLPKVEISKRFDGMINDEESGLYQNGFRYYKPGFGYTQTDPLGLDAGWNQRIYANQNPLRYVDPFGLASLIPGAPGESAIIDGGSSCAPLIPAPRVDDGGCISTGGGPSICVGPGSTSGAGLPMPLVADPKLGNLVKDLYKGARMPTPIGTGSTADAIRNELATGLATEGRFHSQKGAEYARALDNWLSKNPSASHYDRLTAESLRNDLLNALGRN